MPLPLQDDGFFDVVVRVCDDDDERLIHPATSADKENLPQVFFQQVLHGHEFACCAGASK
jgi:hypothetical protein